MVALSVSTPAHLRQIGLLPQEQATEEEDINYLLKQALEVVAFLPFARTVDKYLWDVFRGRITPQNYTNAWWEYR